MGNPGTAGAQGAGGAGIFSFIIMMGRDLCHFLFFDDPDRSRKAERTQSHVDDLLTATQVSISGGIHGKVNRPYGCGGCHDRNADKVRIKVARSAIAAVLQKSGSPALFCRS